MSDRTEINGVTFDYPDPNPYESYEVNCPSDWLNLIPQLRAERKESYDQSSLEGLADTLEGEGQIHRVRVAMLKPGEAHNYIEHFYDLWDISEEDRKSLGDLNRIKGHYFIVIAGHRRTLAIQDSDDIEYVRITLHPSIDPVQASIIQLIENEYSAPDASRKAEMIYRLYILLNEQEGGISKAEIAKRLNIDSGIVYDALDYADMPSAFRSMVEEGLLTYTHVVELHRLKKAGLDTGTLRGYAGLASVGKEPIKEGLTVKEFRKVIDSKLEELENNQQSFFDSPSEVDERNRAVAKKKYNSLARTTETYFRKLGDLIDSGLLGELDSPLSPGAPKKRILGVLDAIEHVVGRLGPEGLPQKKVSETKGRIRNIREALDGKANENQEHGNPQG
jgi:hypothetical protein